MRFEAVKIYGERHSGTNYLRRILEANVAVPQLRGTAPRLIPSLATGHTERATDLYFALTYPLNLGWKHACPDPDRLAFHFRVRRRVLFVTLTKNPYAWLLSLFRRPHHARTRHKRFDAFLSSPWPPLRREHAPAPFSSPMALWNAKNAAYLRLATEASTHTLTYEALVADPERILDDLCRSHDLPRTDAFFTNHTASTSEPSSDKRFATYRQYHLEEHWRAALTAADLALINPHLDAEVMRRFGYSLLLPEGLGGALKPNRLAM